jgi:hypothetical protein
LDTFSHAAWGAATLRAAKPGTSSGRSQRTIRWWVAALAGAMPDLLFFIPSRIEQVIENGWAGAAVGSAEGIWRADGPPLPPELVEAYFRYYVKSHSLVLLTLACLLIWAAGRKRWLWLAVPYALHIFMDMPTHERYMTQPLWPLSTWHMQGLSWADPRIFFPHLAVLIGLFVWLKLSARI